MKFYFFELQDEKHLCKIQNAVDIVVKFADEPTRRQNRGGFRQSDEGGSRGSLNISKFEMKLLNGSFGETIFLSLGIGRGEGEAPNSEEISGRREEPFKMDEETFQTLLLFNDFVFLLVC